MFIYQIKKKTNHIIFALIRQVRSQFIFQRSDNVRSLSAIKLILKMPGNEDKKKQTYFDLIQNKSDRFVKLYVTVNHFGVLIIPDSSVSSATVSSEFIKTQSSPYCRNSRGRRRIISKSGEININLRNLPQKSTRYFRDLVTTIVR